MTDQTEAPAGEGHNQPPPYDAERIDELKAKCDRATREAEDWIAKGDVTDDDMAEALRDFLGKITALDKAVDKARTEDKAPHLEAGRQVDAAYAPLRDRLARLARRVKPTLQAWWNKKEAERQERARREAEAARKAKEEADRAAALAEQSKSIEAEEAAEAARKAAEERQKAAARIEKERTKIASASGGARAASARTRKVAELVSVHQAFLHYKDRPEVAECLTRLANADLRAKDGPAEIPGFNVREERNIA